MTNSASSGSSLRGVELTVDAIFMAILPRVWSGVERVLRGCQGVTPPSAAVAKRSKDAERRLHSEHAGPTLQQ